MSKTMPIPAPCPELDRIHAWLSLPTPERDPAVTAHVFACSSCTRLVMAEIRIRRESRRRSTLSAVAASLVLAVGAWQVGVVLSGPTLPSSQPGEQAQADGYPPPLDDAGNLWVPPGWKRTDQDPTPYPEDEELELGRRSARVVTWLKHRHGYVEVPFAEDGQVFAPDVLPDDIEQVHDMDPAEFREFARERRGYPNAQRVRALDRSIREREPAFIPMALFWLSGSEYNLTTGWRYRSVDLAREYLRLFSREEIMRELRDYPHDHGKKKKMLANYEANFGQ